MVEDEAGDEDEADEVAEEKRPWSRSQQDPRTRSTGSGGMMNGTNGNFGNKSEPQLGQLWRRMRSARGLSPSRVATSSPRRPGGLTAMCRRSMALRRMRTRRPCKMGRRLKKALPVGPRPRRTRSTFAGTLAGLLSRIRSLCTWSTPQSTRRCEYLSYPRA